jgi:hypothetical protein
MTAAPPETESTSVAAKSEDISTKQVEPEEDNPDASDFVVVSSAEGIDEEENTTARELFATKEKYFSTSENIAASSNTYTSFASDSPPLDEDADHMLDGARVKKCAEFIYIFSRASVLTGTNSPMLSIFLRAS